MYTQNDLKTGYCVITNYFNFFGQAFKDIKRNYYDAYYHRDFFAEDFNTYVIVYSDDDYTLLSDNTPLRDGYYNGKKTQYLNGFVMKTKTLLEYLNRPKCVAQLLKGIPNYPSISNKQYLELDKRNNPKELSFIEHYSGGYKVKFNTFDEDINKEEIYKFIEKYNKITAGKKAHWENIQKYNQRYNGNGFSFLEERYEDAKKVDNLNENTFAESLPNKDIKTTNGLSDNKSKITKTKKTKKNPTPEELGYYGSLLDPPTK